MKILVIDDERTFTKLAGDITYLRSLDSASVGIFYDMDNRWDVVYLDHDLGDTGYDVSRLTDAIEAFAYEGQLLPINKFVIHSQNPLGRQRMFLALYKFYNVEFARLEDLL